MLGHLIGSSPSILHMGELAAFYFSCHIAQREYENVPSRYKTEYLEALKIQSKGVVSDICAQNDKAFFVEDTPWNFRIIDDLETLFPNARYVLSYRNPADVISSMQASYTSGYKWAGPTDYERFQLWEESYSCAGKLPRDRTICFDYDVFKADPVSACTKLTIDLQTLGIPHDIDPDVLKIRYAQSHGTKPVEDPRTERKNAFERAAISEPVSFLEDKGQRIKSIYDAISEIENTGKQGSAVIEEQYEL